MMTETKRLKIFQKFNGHCAYCGKPFSYNSMTIDHCIPKCKGGRSTIDNLLPCCWKCNNEKGKKNIEQFRLQQGWKDLSVKDLESYDKAMKALRQFKFYFETANKL